jgi:hypothetical protein
MPLMNSSNRSATAGFAGEAFDKDEIGFGKSVKTNFVLEYELTDWMRLQTNVVEGSTTQQQLFQRLRGTGLDLLFFFSY